MPVQRNNGDASSQQQLLSSYPISAGNRNPQHTLLNSSATVRAQLPYYLPQKPILPVKPQLPKHSTSSSTGVMNSQQKKWSRTQESGHASNKITTGGSTIPIDLNNRAAGGCRPKIRNKMNQDSNSAKAFDMSSTRLFYY